MISFKQIEALSGLENADFLISSFYLCLERGRATNKEAKIITKDLIKYRFEELQRGEVNKIQMDSLETDFSRIQSYIEDLEPGRSRGVALFSCSGADFWQEYRLPRCSANALLVGPKPYKRPLVDLLEQYKRYCVIVVERDKARIFSVYMNEIEDFSSIFSEVPAKVKEAGWYGLEEKRIQRHIEDHFHRHFKQVAEISMQFFKDYHFDWLILGGLDNVLNDFEGHLHNYLQQRLVGKFSGGVGKATVPEILSKSLEVIRQVELRQQQELVSQILDRYRNGGLAVVGLENTLQSLTLGEVHTLAVVEGLCHSGITCQSCKYLGINGSNCPLCGERMQEVEDVIHEAMELAVQQHCQIQTLNNENGLNDSGGIGALLRYKI